MKKIYMGDPHVKPNNLEESDKLMDFVVGCSMTGMVDELVILGDLYDTHNIVRLEVIKFWNKWFQMLSSQCFKPQKRFRTIVLVGNHDISGNYSDDFSALHTAMPLENEYFKIVSDPYLDGIYGYLPYIHSNEKFVEEANRLAEQGAKVLVSHPNFEGAVYDNGTGVVGGISPDLLSNDYTQLIGGHIHTQMEYGCVWYPGNSRWLTKSCANKEKGIWLVDHDDLTGKILKKIFVSTESVCTPIRSYIWREGEEQPQLAAASKNHIELVGSSDWVTAQKKELSGVSISSKITDIKKSKGRKSGKSLYEFLSNHYQAEPEKRQKLISYMRDFNLV